MRRRLLNVLAAADRLSVSTEVITRAARELGLELDHRHPALLEMAEVEQIRRWLDVQRQPMHASRCRPNEESHLLQL